MFQHQPQAGFTGSLSKAGLGIGSTPAELSIAAPNGAGVDFAIAGIAYHLADDGTVAMDAQAVQADLTTCLYLVLLDSAGALTVVKGIEVLTADLAAGITVVQFPDAPADLCPIGAFKVVTSGGTYTGGTTSLADGAVTDTYYDFGGGVAGGPLTA